jgi:hypothetical protein
MPQINFGQVFSTPEESDSPSAQCGRSDQPKLRHKAITRKGLSKFVTAVRLGPSEWTNIVFVAVTFLGGLFCAFYFFNGTELFRATAAWSREFLYPRPPVAVAQKAKGDLFHSGSDQVSPFEENYRRLFDPDRNPFGQNVGWLGLSQPSATTSSGPNSAGSPATVSGSTPASPLNQLNLPAPGGDALFQAFNRAVADLARVSNLDAHRTVVVVQTAVSQTQRRTTTQAKSVKQRAEIAANAAKSTGQQSVQNSRDAGQVTSAANAAMSTGQQSMQNSHEAGQVTSAAQTTATNTVGSVNNMSQPALNTVRGVTSNPSGSFRAPVSLRGGHH